MFTPVTRTWNADEGWFKSTTYEERNTAVISNDGKSLTLRCDWYILNQYGARELVVMDSTTLNMVPGSDRKLDIIEYIRTTKHFDKDGKVGNSDPMTKTFGRK